MQIFVKHFVRIRQAFFNVWLLNALKTTKSIFFIQNSVINDFMVVKEGSKNFQIRSIENFNSFLILYYVEKWKIVNCQLRLNYNIRSSQ